MSFQNWFKDGFMFSHVFNHFHERYPCRQLFYSVNTFKNGSLLPMSLSWPSTGMRKFVVSSLE
jgi:hypothetical protein